MDFSEDKQRRLDELNQQLGIDEEGNQHDDENHVGENSDQDNTTDNVDLDDQTGIKNQKVLEKKKKDRLLKKGLIKLGEMSDHDDDEEYDIRPAKVIAQSFLKGESGGLSEPIVNSGRALYNSAEEAFDSERKQGKSIIDSIKAALDFSTDKDEFQRSLKETIEKRSHERKLEPTYDTAAEFVGSADPRSIPNKIIGGIGKAAEAAKYIPKLIKDPLELISGAAINEGTKETGNQIQNQASGGEFSDEEVRRQTMEGAEAGAMFSGVHAAGKLASVLTKGFVKGLGVDAKILDHYSRRYREIDKAQSRDELTSKVDSVITDIHEKYRQGKIKKEIAEKNIADLRQGLEEELKYAYGARLNKMKENTDLTKYTDDVHAGISKLKDFVVKSSGESREILGKVNGGIPVYKAVKPLRDGLKKILINGQAVGGLDRKEVQIIQGLIDDFNNVANDGQLPFKEVKKILQNLDKQIDTGYLESSNQFSSTLENILKETRASIDGYAKSKVKDYAVKMNSFNKQAALLSKLNDMGKNKDQLSSSLSQILKSTKSEARKHIEQLGEFTGTDYKSILDRAGLEQRQLTSKNGSRQILKSLEENTKLNQFKNEVYSAKKGVPSTTSNRDILDYKKALDTYNQVNKEFSGQLRRMHSQGSSSAVSAFIARKNESTKYLFEKLSKLGDEDFVTAMRDIRAQEALGGPAKAAGSKYVNLFAKIFGAGAVGSATGLGPKTGAGLGVIVGVLSENFAPSVARDILRVTARMRHPPTIDYINSLNLPRGAKTFLRDQLNQFVAIETRKEKKDEAK